MTQRRKEKLCRGGGPLLCAFARSAARAAPRCGE